MDALITSLGISFAICFGIRQTNEQNIKNYKKSGLSGVIFIIYLVGYLWILLDTISHQRYNDDLAFLPLYLVIIDIIALIFICIVNSMKIGSLNRILTKEKKDENIVKKLEEKIETEVRVIQVKKHTVKETNLDTTK